MEAIWGDLCEWTDHFRTATYECSRYRAMDNRRAAKLDYIGQTGITNEKLFEFGNLIHEMVLTF